jgi:hypothetical protein
MQGSVIYSFISLYFIFLSIGKYEWLTLPVAHVLIGCLSKGHMSVGLFYTENISPTEKIWIVITFP